jgi:hypothetical protein
MSNGDTQKMPWEKKYNLSTAPAPVPATKAGGGLMPWEKTYAQPKAKATTPTAVAPPPRRAEQVENTPQAKAAQEANKAIQSWRPRWDRPEEILKDPTWYGRSARYAGGEAIGAGKAAAGVAVGSMKMLHDVASALNPFEGYSRPLGEPQMQVLKDVGEVGKGTLDVAKALWDLIRHFPEAETDPEKFGTTIAQAAMVVDGGAKLAETFGKAFPQATPSAIASGVAAGTKKYVNAIMNTTAVEDAYLHKGGVDIAENHILRATKDAKVTEDVLINNLISKIGNDRSIDPVTEYNDIQTSIAQNVKTHESLPPALKEVMDYGNRPPGTWTWEQVKQLKSKIGAAMMSTSGPMKTVLTQSYDRLRGDLRGVAQRYSFGLAEDFDAYHKLEVNRRKSFDIIKVAEDIVNDNAPGSKMAHALKDNAVTKEVIDSLKSYGLDKKAVLKYAKKANGLLRGREGSGQSLFRYIYRVNPGMALAIPAVIAGRAVGGYIGGLALGGTVGFLANHLVRSARAAMLPLDLLEHALDSRRWQTKIGPVQGPMQAPPQPPPQLPPPTTTAPAAGGGAAPQGTLPMAPAPMPAQLPASAPARLPAPAQAQLPAPAPAPTPSEPKVTKVTEGEAGREAGKRAGTTKETKLARQAKARERVAAKRAEKGPTALGGGGKLLSGGGKGDAAREAQEVANIQRKMGSPVFDVSKLQIPELEEHLRQIAPKEFKDLQAIRKEKGITDEEYIAGLRVELLYALEELGNKE